LGRKTKDFELSSSKQTATLTARKENQAWNVYLGGGTMELGTREPLVSKLQLKCDGTR
jgi:hypothetical protein